MENTEVSTNENEEEKGIFAGTSPEEILKLLEEAKINTLSTYPFYITFALTHEGNIDILTNWDFATSTIKNTAVLLKYLCEGAFNKEIIMNLTALAGDDNKKLVALARLLRRWNKLNESDDRPFIDPFQPVMDGGSLNG